MPSQNPTAIDAQQARAIGSFIQSCTTPLLYNTQDGIGSAGTGTLLTASGRYFVLTAAHVCTELLKHPPDLFGMPESPNGPAILTFQESYIKYSSQESHDVGVIEIMTPPLVTDMQKRGWSFLPLPQEMQRQPHATYLVAGYPVAEMKADDLRVIGKLFSFATTVYENPIEATEQPFDARNEFAVRYDNGLSDLEGKQLPSLRGISGSSIWHVHAPSEAFWSPTTALQIVGVQTRASTGSYVRAAKWAVAAALFRKIGISVRA